MKHWGFIMIGISALLLWGWLATPITGMANTADSPATIRFDGKAESSNQRTDGEGQLHVSETSNSNHSATSGLDHSQAKNQPSYGWLPQTNEQWWLSAFVVGIASLIILICWQLITYLKKRSSLL